MAVAGVSPQPIGDILRVEAVGNDRFDGMTGDASAPARLFGGHILAQGLLAAYHTVEARRVHVMHTQFLSPGQPGPPIRYAVERIRDGRSFSTRQIVARQDGRVLCTMSASFHVPETGFDHQERFCSPLVPPLPDDGVETGWAGIRLVELPEASTVPGAHRHFWFRIAMPDASDAASDDAEVAATDDAAMAYASDIKFGTTPLLRHGRGWSHQRDASLDHSVWFHRSGRPSDWTFFAQHSPSAAGGRGFTRGEIRGADGALQASVAQDSLIRDERVRAF
jgi:acyl-CoA thioesterase-2